MTRYRKKLIEVALPLAAINKEAAREKSIRHGHPSTLHLWWARRPLAACRAVLFASLVTDPDDDLMFAGDEDLAASKRAELFSLIEDLVKWENSNNPQVIRKARAEIARCRAVDKIESGEWKADEEVVPGATGYDFKHMLASPEAVDAFLAKHMPPVLDPFCGGGSIPLEAQRLGLRAHASDLNPVPVLITKALIEIPPKFAGIPPVNLGVGNRREELENSALSRTDGLEKGDGGGEGSLSAGAKTAAGGNLRDAVADHAGGDVDSGEHRGGLDTGVKQGEGEFSVDRSGVARRDGNISDALRGDRVVSDRGDCQAAEPADRGREDADHLAKKVPGRQIHLTSNQLFPKSYPGAAGLAEDVRYYGQWMRDEAEKRIGHLYPKVKITQAMIDDGRPDLEPYKDQELTVIAWIWARTVASPDPSVGGKHVPLVRSFWLSKKKGKEAYVRPVIDRRKGTYEFKVQVGKPTDDFDPNDGTVVRTGGTCLIARTPMSFDYIREEGKAGRMAHRLMAVVCEGTRGRVYISPLPEHEDIASQVEADDYPVTDLPEQALSFRVQLYGMDQHWKLFTPRQLTALTTFSDLVKEAREQVLADAKQAWRAEPRAEPRSVNADSSPRTALTAITDHGSRKEQHVFHITFGTYGMRLHGDDRPAVHHARNKFGEPFEPPDPQRVRYIRENMTQAPVILSVQQRQFIEETVPRLCERGGWTLHEVAAQKDHVHVLLSANAEAKKVRRWLKTWLAQALNEQWKQAKWWAKGGSCKHVFDDDYFFAARQYVAKQKTASRAALCESSPTSTANADPASTTRGSCQEDDRPLHDGGTGPQAYADAVATYLAFGVSRQANRLSTISFWDQTRQNIQQAFGRQALPMTWDFCEANPFSDSSGNWTGQLVFPRKCLEHAIASGEPVVRQLDTTADAAYSGEIISTDPPYYDNIGYADLSDFFYVWLRRSLGDVYPQLFATLLTPKAEELIASPYRHGGSKQKAAEFFETGLGSAIGKWRKHGNPDYPTTIFYAFKQAETDKRGTASTGWETFLTGVIEHGFVITGTWPMRTELTGNLKKNVAALASSVVLVCVPRSDDAPLATRREFLNALKRELPDALRNLQSGNIAPVDLAQAAIGPGMAIFSRYAKVVEADGEPMTVRAALTLINQVLDEVLAEQEGEFDADTRWAVAWFEQFGTAEGDFGVAETLSKAKNTSVEGLVEAGVVRSRAGRVQLLGARASRPHLPDPHSAGGTPALPARLTEWEAVQHLIRALDQQGETGAADLLRKLGGDYSQRARDLAYRLYNLCERKGWAGEAIAYNSLVLAWPEISKLARQAVTERDAQTTLFENSEE